MLFFLKEEVQAGTYDNAYTFYTQFSGTNLMQAKDGYIYIGNRAGAAASTSSYLFNARGHRFTVIINGIQYYIDLKRGLYGGIYDQNISDMTVGGYVYNLYRIPYQTICQLMQYNYPTIDFGMLYQTGQTVRLTYDSIMTIKKRKSNGSYTLYGDLSNDHLGRPTTWGNLYFDQSTMEKAWKQVTGQRRSFQDFYHLQILIPGSEKGVFLHTSAICIKDGPGVFKVRDDCYVRSGQLIDYSFLAYSSFASATFQPNYMYLDLQDARTASYVSTWLYSYAPTGRVDGSVNNHIPHRFSLESCSFSRTDYNRCLSYIGRARIPSDGEQYFITPRCAIFLNDRCQVVSVFADRRLGVHVISDGKAPDIVIKKQGNLIHIQISDAGSGFERMKICSEDGKVELESTEAQIDYNPLKSGKYKILAVDHVGNQQEVVVPVELISGGGENQLNCRFFSKEFMEKGEEDGGLNANSIWRTDIEKNHLLEETMNRMERCGPFADEILWIVP